MSAEVKPPFFDRLFGLCLHAWEGREVEPMLLEHEELLAQLLEFGAHLEKLSELELAIPDELYLALTDSMEALDLIWDKLHGEPVEADEPLACLAEAEKIFQSCLPLLQDLREDMSDEATASE